MSDPYTVESLTALKNKIWVRTRIIAALAQADQDWCSDRPLHEDMADAVIAALNLNTPVEYLSVDGKRKNFMVAGHYTVEIPND
jgi:hypothetical protein